MNQTEALNDLVQRFAISALSIERKNEALNEEILVDKFTGEFYIKSKDGIILSSDILNRENASTNEAIRIAELMGMTGELYKIELDGLSLPSYIDVDVNFLQNEPIEIPPETKELLINLDIDQYEVVDGLSKKIHEDVSVSVYIEVTASGKLHTIEKTVNINNLNYTLLSLRDYEDITSIKISNITINSINIENHMLVLHNLFVTLNS